MRIGIITKGIATTNTSTVGGGDVFNVYLLRALKELGHRVVLSANDLTQWGIIERDLGWVFRPDIELKRPSSRILDRAKSFTQFIIPRQIRMLKHACDITFNTYGDNLFWNTDLSYQLSPYTKEQLSAKYSTVASKLYYEAYLSVFHMMKRRIKTLILTDSYYAKKIIEDTTGLHSEVLYLPVNTDFYKQALRYRQRLDHVAAVGRLTWEKNFQIIPEIAKRTRKAVFNIIGSTVSTESNEVVRFIRRRSLELDVADKVRIYMNRSTAERLSILEKCKVYVNCWKGEYFGIVVAEAMSAGLAPIVPNHGGQVEIVPDKGHLYKDFDEAARKIDGWLSNWSPREAERLSKRAERFSYRAFRANLSETLDRVIGAKRR